MPNAETALEQHAHERPSLSISITSVPTTTAFMAMNEIEKRLADGLHGNPPPESDGVRHAARLGDDEQQNSTTIVVTLMPPAVDAGPAPTNISIICVSQVSSRICA